MYFIRVSKRPHPTAAEKKKICAAVYSGHSIAHVAKLFDCHRNSVRRWMNEAEAGGDFSRAPGGGRPAKIDCKAGQELLKILKQPASKFGFETDCWSTPRIKVVCEKVLKIKLSRMAIFRTLQRYDYAYKTPERQYYETNTQAQKEWVKTVVPQINALVKKKQAILYFMDESHIELSPALGKTWAPRGKRIKQKVTGNRGSVSVISAISKGGYLLFNLFDKGKRFNGSDIVVWLMEMLAYHPGRHLVVVMDRARPHTSKILSQRSRDYMCFICRPALQSLIRMSKSGPISRGISSKATRPQTAKHSKNSSDQSCARPQRIKTKSVVSLREMNMQIFFCDPLALIV